MYLSKSLPYPTKGFIKTKHQLHLNHKCLQKSHKVGKRLNANKVPLAENGRLIVAYNGLEDKQDCKWTFG